jgi:lysophospholipase L1-like esterase
MNQQLETGSLSFPREIVKEMFQTMPLGAIDQKKAEEGRDIKTARAFRQNIEAIVETAATRGDRILLLTYAYDIPAGYTPELFASHSLAYGDRGGGYGLGANGWGKPAYVAAAVDAHNAVIRGLAEKHGEALFVDEQELIPKQQWLFLDPCHFTHAGCRRFVDSLWPVVARRIAEWRDGDGRRAGGGAVVGSP